MSDGAERVVFARLTANPSGTYSLVATRVYPLMAPPRATTPFVVYTRISGERETSVDGPAGLAMPRIQVDAYATTYAAAKGLATAVRQRLDGFTGTAGGVAVGSVTLIGDRDFFESDVDPKLYRVSMDFEVAHAE